MRLFLLAALLLTSPGAAAQDDPPRAEVMILGTYHMDNPGLDEFNVDAADVLTPTKQAEVAAVVDALARFGPTKVAIEALPEWAPEFDSLYAAYRGGTRDLERDEREQIGFRLAAHMGHDRLYAIDYHNGWPFEAVETFAEAHDPGFLAFYREWGGRMVAAADSVQRHGTVAEAMRFNNDEASMLAPQRMFYARLAAVGDADEQPGVAVVAGWYARNLRIFANLAQAVEPGDRVVVLFGSGHAPILRDLVAASPDMDLVEPDGYLE